MYGIVDMYIRSLHDRKHLSEKVSASSNQNFAGLAFSPVQNKVGLRTAVLVETEIIEKLRTKTGTCRSGQETSWNDLISINISYRQYYRARSDLFHRGHSIFLASATRPRTADAAAVAGLASTVRAPTP